MSNNNTATIGIDLGGSNSYACVFDTAGRKLAADKIATQARRGYEHVIGRLAEQVVRLSTEAERQGTSVVAVGLAVPGIVGSHGLLSVAPNLGWENCRPLDDLGLQVPGVLLNDVDAGLLGEIAALPEARVPGVAVAYFCGTGIGGAVAVNGQLVVGQGAAGEVGHMVVRRGGRRCGCGRRGCLEAYIGKWALNRRVARALKNKTKTALSKIIEYDLKKEPIKSSSLKKAYFAGDGFTHKLLDEYYVDYLAIGMSQSANLLNPQLIILGGGIMESLGAELLPFIKKRLARHCINTPPELRLAELGDDAGPRGAAARALSAVAGGGAGD